MKSSALINIDVDDIEKATKFYTGAFGLQVARKFGTDFVELLGLQCPVYLLKKDSGSLASIHSKDKRSFDRHWTPVHLDISVDDIESAFKNAISLGAKAESEIQTKKWGKIALMSDPFGHGFCLLQFLGRGYDELID